MASPAEYELEDMFSRRTATFGEEGIHARRTTTSTLQDPQSEPTERAGVAQAEAMRPAWTLKWLIAAYTAVTLVHFVNSLQQSAAAAFNPFVTSHFKEHGLTAIVTVVANVVGGVTKLPLALFIDIVGRSQGFFVCSVLIVLSLVLMAVGQNLPTYTVAQVFYWCGQNGVHYVLEIFIADTSRLSNRIIWFAIVSLPYVANAFIGSSLGDFFLHHSTWRWGFGSFAIFSAVAALIFCGIFWFIGRKAERAYVKRRKSNRTVFQSMKYWFVEFDVIGLVLISGGFSLLLLPFGLANEQAANFASPLFICMVIFGLVLLALFAVYEKYASPKNFFPFHLMKDRSVAAACLLGFNHWLSFYCYRNFYSSYLQVVFQLSVAKAGWIINIYNVVSCIWAVIISFAFKYTDRYKWGVIIAVPMQILMIGQLVLLRSPGNSIAALVVVEVISAFSAAMMLQVEQIAIMASVPHQNLAVALALLFMLQTLGGAVGATISGAIWTQMIPSKIEKYLPLDSKIDAMKLYNSLYETLALPWDSVERQAVVRAYRDGQKTLLISGAFAFLPGLMWMCLFQNHRMSDRPFGKRASSA
ncbi:hypothetical protein J1614_004172 [Plenodomus biglobosus]|nr:hypothetical protein J1614_004172 [Plenodomus biglobosus]